MKNLKQDLFESGCALGVYRKTKCTQDETQQFSSMSKLPDHVYLGENDGVYYKYERADISNQELMEYLAIKQASNTSTVKAILIFFAIIAGVGLAIWLFSLSAALH